MNVAGQCRMQAGWCETLGSPLYAHILRACADDYEGQGAVFQLLAPCASDPAPSALPLRMMGAVHRLVLQGQLPELARFYPSVGGEPRPDGAWEAFRTALAVKPREIGDLLGNPVQTNEAGRSGTLLGGFLRVAEEFRLPLRLLELGASAGLNLCWDRYRYEWPGGSWGDASSPLSFQDVFTNQPPSFPSAVEISERAGCDRRPINPGTEEGRLTLLSFLWADQTERIARLRSACEIASSLGVLVEKSSAAEWLERRLAGTACQSATVVFHSVVWQYLPETEREAISQTIPAAGRQATKESPLAWLRMEPREIKPGEPAGTSPPELRLQMYPGGGDHLLATSSFHAPAVHWIGE